MSVLIDLIEQLGRYFVGIVVAVLSIWLALWVSLWAGPVVSQYVHAMLTLPTPVPTAAPLHVIVVPPTPGVVYLPLVQQ